MVTQPLTARKRTGHSAGLNKFNPTVTDTMSNGNPTITIATQKNRRPRRQRRPRKNQNRTVEVHLNTTTNPPPAKPARVNRGARLSKQLANSQDRSMVPIPRDSQSRQASSNAKQTTLKTIMNVAHQIVNSRGLGEIVRAPCLVNFKNHCTKFNKVLNETFNSTGNLNGRFVPQPHFIELANTLSYPNPATIGMDCVAVIDPSGPTKGRGRVFITSNTGSFKVLDTVPKGSDGPSPVFWIPMNVNDGLEIEFNPLWMVPELVYSLDDTTGDIFQESIIDNATTFTNPGQWVGFSFVASTVEPVTVSFTTGIGITIPAGFLYTPAPISLPEDVQLLRFSLLNGLVTFTGSSLENQGNIVMAVTDPDWYQTTSDLYTELSSLPDKRFNGPLKKGCYGWWTPCTIEEETPQNPFYYDRLPHTSCIRFAIKGASEGQTVKIEGEIGAEFYSPQQVYSHVPCIPKSPIFGHLYHLFNLVPHVMPNDEHDDICKGIMGRITKTVNAAIANPAALTLGVLAMM